MSSKSYDIDILKRIEDDLLDDNKMSESVEKIGKDKSDIQKYFADQCIFLTGATGFLGKMFIEKVLRSCPDVEGIFVLIREKKGESVQNRLETMFEDKLFDVLKKENPKFRNKIHAISGDVAQPKLGIHYEDMKMIFDRVSIIIHGAATVKFNEKLGIAHKINVSGTKEILEIAKECKKLKSFVHISTAYAFCVRKEIEEKFYDPPMKSDELFQIVEDCPGDKLDIMTPSLLGEYPNTYAFTKAIAEDLVREYANEFPLPICIFRPSIVTTTYREPVRGWTDNMYGTTGVLVGAGLGILKTLQCDPDVVTDVVPVDLVINAILTASWLTAKTYSENPPKGKDYLQIFNYISSSQKPITFRKFMALNELYGNQVPSMKSISYYCLTLNKNKYIDLIYRIFLHYLPAVIFDLASVVAFKKPQLIKMYKKIDEFAKIITYFTLRQWQFSNRNVRQMWDKMNPYDKRLFNFDISQLDWDHYCQTMIPGIRVYLIKEDLSNLPEAKVRWNRLRKIHQASKVLGVMFAVFILFCFVKHFFNCMF